MIAVIWILSCGVVIFITTTIQGVIREEKLERIIRSLKAERYELWEKSRSDTVFLKEIQRLYNLNDSLISQLVQWKAKYKQLLKSKINDKPKLP